MTGDGKNIPRFNCAQGNYMTTHGSYVRAQGAHELEVNAEQSIRNYVTLEMQQYSYILVATKCTMRHLLNCDCVKSNRDFSVHNIMHNAVSDAL